MSSTAPENEPAITLPRVSAATALAGYLHRLDAGSSESPADFVARHPALAAELSDFLSAHELLRQAAATVPAGELYQAATLAGTTKSNKRILATAQTLVGSSLSPTSASPPPIPGIKTFGDYELLSLIAKGGMGAVYKARQRKLNRIVAIKMILAGQFADQEDIDRFYAEAEAAANLRHPNIVAIHEVGVYEGQHFFSMDYIAGKSLSELVRENPLPPKQAAEYVRSVARAMQFAHEQGILHRDLKPSNVLLDTSGEPLITDFGLAKRVSGQSQLTATGAVVGTPSYMPPEQASADAAKVGPASDVYSMGAILYELLTGRPPFIAATIMLTIRQVLESEPVSPRLLNSNVPSDLETICIKCLQKEPSHRYPTAQELVDELTRFLNGEPILARPIGPAARALRWCKRNPLVASLGALAAFAFLVAFAASTIGYIQTRAALADSEESFQQARTAVDELFTEVSEDTLLNQHGMQPLRDKLLRRALVYYERFLEQRGNDPKLHDELASALFRVGLITEAIGQANDARRAYERAAEMQRTLVAEHPSTKKPLEDLGKTLSALGKLNSQLKAMPHALTCYREAIEVRERLVKLDDSDLESQRWLANSYMNLGLFHRNALDPAAARDEFNKAQAIRAAALARQSGNQKLRRDLGKGHYNLATLALDEDDVAEARRQYELAVKEFEQLRDTDPEDLANQELLALCYREMAELERAEGQPAAALAMYGAARRLLDALVRRNPQVLDYQTELAKVHLNLGGLHHEGSNSSEAIAAFQQAHDLLVQLVNDHELVPNYRRDLAVAMKSLALEQLGAGETAAGRKHLTESLWHLDKLLAEDGKNEDWRTLRIKVADELRKLDAPAP